MGISFDAPVALLLLPPLLAVVIALHLSSRRRLGVGRRRTALVVRVLLLTVLVSALAGLQLVLPVDRLAVVFVVDLSDSVGTAGREESLAYVRESLAAKKDEDVAGIVAFGGDALVERLPSELAEIDRIASTPVTSATDVGAALRLAAAMFPDDAQKRIVLLSDGNDTTGSGQTEAALAAARGIRVETVLTGLEGRDEVVVERLTAPSTARLGEEVEVSGDITSTVEQPATVRLFVNGELARTQPVELAKGPNRVTFTFTPRDPGFLRFRIAVEAGRDTFNQNDHADANTIVKGEPRVLVVKGDEDVAAQLVAALKTERQLVDTIIPEALPADLSGLAEYDSVVLVDVPRLRLTDKALAALQVYVRDLGRGLMMVGGPRSYGAGGYTDTALEETLPVDMGVRDRQKQPDVALVVVIDKSGSMDACHCNGFNGGMGGGTGIAGVKKVDIGKEAILRAASALTAQDELGVVAFDQAAHWVVRTAPVGGLQDLQGAIAGITPNGQTNIFGGLDQAVQSLKTATATRRHIILLTDGWSSSGQYDSILQEMKAAGITLSTVGAGGGANPFLEQLAKEGGGRFYAAVNPASIPDIFLKETQQVSGQQIVEEAFFPILTSSSPIMRGIVGGMPQLLGYNGTTAKPAAQTVLVTARDDPLLAQWQYGLGRSVAWTSDSTGRWAKSWIGWNGFSKFFSQMVGWTFPGEESGGIEAAFVDRGGRTYLRVESLNADGSPRDFYATRVTLVAPDAHFTTTTVNLNQIAPGVYEVPVANLLSGAYAVRVTQTKPGESPLARTLGLVAPTAAEYRLLGANEPLLAAIRSATGGSALATPAEAWVHDLRSTSQFTDLWPWLLVLALLLWPLDIALRRVSLGRRELADGRRWVSDRVHGRRVAARTKPVEGMLAARDRAGSAAARTAILREAAERPLAGANAAGGAEGTGRAAAAGPTTPAPAEPSASQPVTSAAIVPPPASLVPSSPPAAAASPGPGGPEPADTMTRLREAKRRTRS
ncbi:MAG TPA: VWA domain-containing protein [Candidatus Limnocylindrales bacterium]